MCGELDEDILFDDEVFARLTALARRHGVEVLGEPAPLGDIAEGDGRRAYMDGLFNAGLTRALSDAKAAGEGARVDAIANQAIVFARLAGFLAGQLPPAADLLKTTMEALLDGHAEPARAAAAMRAHDHHHHDHDHDHEHGHHHHAHG